MGDRLISRNCGCGRNTTILKDKTRFDILNLTYTCKKRKKKRLLITLTMSWKTTSLYVKKDKLFTLIAIIMKIKARWTRKSQDLTLCFLPALWACKIS